jgi:tetratricopeptide (TPR) repeat protein
MSEPESQELWLQRAFHLLRLGRVEDARVAAFEALAINHESVTAFTILAQVEIKLKNFASGRIAAERILAVAPEHYYGFLYLAISSFYDAGFQPPRQVRWFQLETTPPRFAYAESLLKIAISKVPDRPDAWIALGRMQFAMGYRRKALKSVDQALAAGGPEPKHLLLKSQILRGLRKHAQADETLRLSLSLNPEDGWAHQEAARAAFSKHDLVTATEHAVAAVRLDPNNPAHREEFFKSLQIQSPVTRILLKFELLILTIQNWQWSRKIAWLLFVPIAGVLALHAIGLRDDRDVTIPPLLITLFPFIPVGPGECARLIQILHQKTVFEHRRIVIFDLACRAVLPFVILGVAAIFLYTKHVGVIVAFTCSLILVTALLDFLNGKVE